VAKAPAVVSLALSGLAWLGVLSNYVWAATWPRDLAILVLACGAAGAGLLAVARRARRALDWAALAVSVAFPVWLWQVLSGLSGDAF
jgi:hypothetical protein